MQNRKLEYKQQVMEKEVGDMQEAFDGALAVLRREKLHLEADVKAAQIKRLTYQQELQLLKVGHCGILSSTICLKEVWRVTSRLPRSSGSPTSRSCSCSR